MNAKASFAKRGSKFTLPPQLQKPSTPPTKAAEVPASNILDHLGLSPDEHVRLETARRLCNEYRKEKMSLRLFTKRALMEKVNRYLFPGHPLQELEYAVNQARGFIRLAHDHFMHLDGDGGPRDVQLEWVGVMTLADETSARLRDAFDSAHHYATGKAS